MRVLGIETSCDETAAAVYDAEAGLLSNIVYSQLDLHRAYGGVVPELAARDHSARIVSVVTEALNVANSGWQDISAVAYTAGPGLVGALLVGSVAAKSMAFAAQLPAIAIHHLEAHLMAIFLNEPAPRYPFLALLVSGGHTQLLLARGLGQYELLSETVDDAVGEAFDKTAKLLGLPYPGGPEIERLAKEGDPARFDFPRPMCQRNQPNLSFSGLKTAVRECIQSHPLSAGLNADIASSFQQAVFDTLLFKVKQAVALTGVKQLVVVGGVSANQALRESLTTGLSKDEVAVYFPTGFSTDNAAMVAYTGYLRLQRDTMAVDSGWPVKVKTRWPLTELD